MNVVLFDKVCKTIGEDRNEVGALTHMAKSLLEEKDKLLEEVDKFQEVLENRYQAMNDAYLEEHKDLTEKISEAKASLNQNERADNTANVAYLEKELKRLEKGYQKMWEGRPFKDVIPKWEYKDENYVKIKTRLEEIEEDLIKLYRSRGEGIRDRNRKIYDEYVEVCEDLREDEEYRRAFHDEDPRNVNLSKSKLSKRLIKKIGRVKGIMEEKKYLDMEEKDMYQENSDLIGGDVALNPLNVLDMNDSFSVLKRYNRGVSNEFIDKNKDILLKRKPREERWRELDECLREGRERMDERTVKMNQAFERINEFDRKHKERNSFIDKVFNWFVGVWASIFGSILLFMYLPRRSTKVGDIDVDAAVPLFKKVALGIVLLVSLPSVVLSLIYFFKRVMRLYKWSWRKMMEMFSKDEEETKKKEKSIE